MSSYTSLIRYSAGVVRNPLTFELIKAEKVSAAVGISRHARTFSNHEPDVNIAQAFRFCNQKFPVSSSPFLVDYILVYAFDFVPKSGTGFLI